MKKILIGLTYYLPNISGVTQYAVILAEELQKRKYKIEIISAKFKKELKNEEIVNGIRIRRLSGININKGFLMPTYFYQAIDSVKRNDVVIINLPSIESFWLIFWAKIFHKKTILIHHCEFTITGPLANRVIGLLTYPIHWFCYQWADKIVAYTKDYAKTSIFLRNFKNKIEYIIPPIKQGDGKAEISFKKNKKIIGFVGRIAWEKGIGDLIEAFKKVREKIDSQLVLIGPYEGVIGDKSYEKYKNEEVTFVGPIDHKYLKNYYEKLDCLVLPSTNNLETFGIVQVEAMQNDCPVIASNLPGVRIPVQMTRMGELTEPGNITQLTEKISIVLKNGKKFYQQRAINMGMFGLDKTISAFEKLILEDDHKQ